MPLVKVCMTLRCMFVASLSRLSRGRQCDTRTKEGSLGSKTFLLAITGGVNVTNNVVNLIIGLWAISSLMVTAEPDMNAFPKYDELNRPWIDCVSVL